MEGRKPLADKDIMTKEPIEAAPKDGAKSDEKAGDGKALASGGGDGGGGGGGGDGGDGGGDAGGDAGSSQDGGGDEGRPKEQGTVFFLYLVYR